MKQKIKMDILSNLDYDIFRTLNKKFRTNIDYEFIRSNKEALKIYSEMATDFCKNYNGFSVKLLNEMEDLNFHFMRAILSLSGFFGKKQQWKSIISNANLGMKPDCSYYFIHFDAIKIK